jgi:hypothetical protein
MYNRASFPRNGKWARHLLRLANISNIQVDPQLKEIAKETSYDPTLIPSTLKWSSKEYNALQYVMDWNGRCVLLDTKDPGFARHVSVIAAKQLGSKRIMIIAKSHNMLLEWSILIRNICQNDGVTISEARGKGRTRCWGKDSCETQWILAEYNEFQDVAFVSDEKPDHLIFDVDVHRSVDYSFLETFEALCDEFNKVTIIAKSPDFWNNPSDQNASSAINQLTMYVVDNLKLNLYHGKIPSLSSTSPSAISYYRPRGVRVDSPAFFEASGVCFNLVMDKISKHFKNVFSNNMLEPEHLHNSARRKSIIERYREVETNECTQLGKSIKDIVSDALEGDKSSCEALERMKTTEWAKLKSHTFYNLVRESTRTEEKTIVVAANATIRKYMGTQLSAQIISSTDSNSTIDEQLGNFAYPHPNCKKFTISGPYKRTKVIVVDDITMLDERIFEVVDRVIFAEFPYDKETISCYIELSKMFRFRTLFGTMRGTFEEDLAEQLLAAHY